jgi:hypothetical protein
MGVNELRITDYELQISVFKEYMFISFYHFTVNQCQTSP